MKTGALLGLSGLIAASFLAAPLAALAGGTVTGKVTTTAKPEKKEFSFSKFPNPKFCPKNPSKALMDGDKRFMPLVEVGKDGGLKNAVVAIKDIEDAGFMGSYAGTDVSAEFCEFLPFAGVVVKQKSFRVVNKDADPDDPKSVKGVLHNPHSFEVKGASSATVFNIGLAEKDSKLDKPVVLRQDKAGSFFRLQCDQHEFMQSFFLPVTNPFFAVVKEDGSFELKDVPAGKHKLVVWHPFIKKGQAMEIDVDVPEGGKAEVKAALQ